MSGSRYRLNCRCFHFCSHFNCSDSEKNIEHAWNQLKQNRKREINRSDDLSFTAFVINIQIWSIDEAIMETCSEIKTPCLFKSGWFQLSLLIGFLLEQFENPTASVLTGYKMIWNSHTLIVSYLSAVNRVGIYKAEDEWAVKTPNLFATWYFERSKNRIKCLFWVNKPSQVKNLHESCCIEMFYSNHLLH